MEYTKGEWKATDWHTVYPSKEKRIYSDSGLIATLNNDMPELEANANLIASAPDLYEACKEIWAYLAPKCHEPKVKIICDKLGQALTKVEGK